MSRPKKKKAHEKEPNLERWLVSYADFITLLFAVFVMLYAMSIVDQEKMEEVQASIQSSFSGPQTLTPALKVIGNKDFGLIPEAVEPPVPVLDPVPTCTWKVPVSVVPRPSVTVYWTESLPCQPATGLYLMVPSEPNEIEPPAAPLAATEVTFSVPLPLSLYVR